MKCRVCGKDRVCTTGPVRSWTCLHGGWDDLVMWHGLDAPRCSECAVKADASRARCIERAEGNGDTRMMRDGEELR